MSETISRRRSALEGVYTIGDFTVSSQADPVVILERHPLSIVQVAVWHFAVEPVLVQLQQTIGITLSQKACIAVQNDCSSGLWLGPDRWLIVEREHRDLEQCIRQAVDLEQAVITDQGHSRCVLRLSGVQTRDILRKGCSLDMDTAYFLSGEVRSTSLFHMNVLLHCLSEDTFDIYVARSFAQSFFAVLRHAAAEYGYRVSERGD